jgi:hypothetical protein
MYSYDQFLTDYKTVQDYYEAFSRNIDWMAAPDPQRAWGLYQQAKGLEVGVVVIGRTCVDEKGRKPKQFGNAFTVADHRNLGVITHADEEDMVSMGKAITNVSIPTGGLVMHFYGGVNSEWRGGKSGYHFLYNDAWLLGAAHKHCNFNLVSPRWEKNIWDDSGYLTCTGREIVFLSNHGYQLGKAGGTGIGGESYWCSDERKADGATLVSLGKAIRSITSREQILDLCVPMGMTAALQTMCPIL